MSQTEKVQPKGYMGRILTVDLTKHTFFQSTLDPVLCDLFLGGRGLGIAILTEHFIALEQEGKYKDAFKEVDPLWQIMS